MADQSTIQATLAAGKLYVAELTSLKRANLIDGCDCDCSDGKLERLDYIVSALNYQVAANLYNGTTDTLYEMLVAIIGNHEPEVGPTPLEQPVLAWTMVDHDTLKGEWDVIENAAGYKLEVSTASSMAGASVININSGETVEYSVNSLTPETTYYARLTALAEEDSDYGDSQPSTIESATTDDLPLIEVKYGWSLTDPYADLQGAGIELQKSLFIAANTATVFDLHDMPAFAFPIFELPVASFPEKNYFSDSGSSFNQGPIDGFGDFRIPFVARGNNIYTTYAGITFSSGNNDRVTLSTV